MLGIPDVLRLAKNQQGMRKNRSNASFQTELTQKYTISKACKVHDKQAQKHM
jgi:hypothetical protein